MKVKIDFVSNSSTTSFCMWGIKNEDGDFLKTLELEDNYKKMKQLNLDYVHCYEDGTTYIGRELFRLKEDQTLREFKEEVVEGLKQMGIDASYTSIEFLSESWFDG